MSNVAAKLAELLAQCKVCDDNARLKHAVADLTLDRHLLQDVLKKSGKPGAPQSGTPGN